MNRPLVILDRRMAVGGIVALAVGLLGLFGLLYWGISHPGSFERYADEVFFICIGILILVGIVALKWGIARVERD